MQGSPQGGALVGFERRRTPRFCCTGEAEIRRLPSDGTLFAGKLRNLGLGGCYIETVSPLRFGTQTEILLRVNASCFRTMGLVKATHNRPGIGVQFIRMSSRGHAILEELLFEMGRLRAAMSAARLVRRENCSGQARDYRRSGSRSIILAETIPSSGRVLPPEPVEAEPIIRGRARLADPDLIARILDLFA